MIRKILFGLLFSLITLNIYAQAPQIVPANFPGIKGLWEFNNSSNLLEATFGNSLVLTGTHSQINGPVINDGAVRIGTGSYYTCQHNIPANGGGNEVNEYSLVFDFKIPQVGPWYSFYQANASNSNDAELFINTSGQIGRSTSGPGYSTFTVFPNVWYRMVVCVDLGNYYKVYLDGVLILNGGSLSIDGEYALYPQSGQNLIHFFADNNGEDGTIDIALAAIFDHPLSQSEVNQLGGYGNNIPPIITGITPYLQSPTPNSIYVSWHSTQTSSTIVEYGTTSNLGLSQNGSVATIGGKKWHTVKLTGLAPNTEYYYKCISNSDVSEVYQFRTPPSSPNNQHFRFILLGDSRTDVLKTTQIANVAKHKAMELFGQDIHNHINMVIHVGDIVTTGSQINQYENEYFKPYASLTSSIPFMVIIGNHENESSNYYNYMKYEDFSDFTGSNSEKFYSFYYLNQQFIFINGNTPLQNSVQTQWLHQKLTQSQSNQDVDMVFCFTHQPGRSELWPDGNTSYIQNDIIPILQQYDKVQLLAYGHSHNYERGTVESKSSISNGDFYIMLTGGAGSALDRWGMYPNQTDYDEIMLSLDHYIFNIVDIDIDNQSFELFTYSLGHNDKPLNVELVDYIYRKLNQEAPLKPIALSPHNQSSTLPVLVASPFEGVDSVFSAKYQITASPGNYNNPIFEKRVDIFNFYGDSGTPNYTPINLNQNIDIRRLTVNTPLTIGNTYGWRIAYRDNNQKWSEWSDEKTFTVTNTITPYTDFTANITQGTAPLPITFTDLSYPPVNTWNWDFDNNGSNDSQIQDPTFLYQTPGFYAVKLTTPNGSIIKDLYINVEDNTVEIIENKSNDILRINPNPCFAYTNIELYLSKSAYATLTIYDISGKIITQIHNGKIENGKHNFTWDLTQKGKKIPAGNYFIKLNSNDLQLVKKIIVIDK